MSASVVCEVVMNGADDVELVGYFGLQRHEFADFDAAYVGGDGFEDATILRRSVGFHVVHFHVGWSAGKPHENDGGIGLEQRFC